MEDAPIKAIIIGVSIFITMTVLSTIVLYFNTAKGVADIVNKRIDIADSYDRIMNEDIFEGNLTGVEVRSLITKYIGNPNVIINVAGDNNVNNNSNWIITLENAKIVRESKMDKINPVTNYKVNKMENEDKITLNIHE